MSSNWSWARKLSVAGLVWFACGQLLAQGVPTKIPDPDPELERKTFEVPEGFEVNLWASDPLLAKPIHMNFDARGRLWVASSEVYPQIKPGQVASDKVIVLEDADRDGKAEKTSVFADGLLIPTGIAPGTDGAYVVNSTELLYLRDTDGDGKADQRQVVLSGFGTEDTHHLLHSLRWGHDGCLYMNQSIYIHSHVETPYGVKRLNGGGIWRFRPETLELDVLCYGFVNSWGHHFDAWGQSFATDGAYGEGINYVFPGSVFFTAVGAKRIVAGLNPGSPKHCGLEILSGRHLPADWQGTMVTNDFRAHRVCRFVVTEENSGYASRQEKEVIKSTHVAFRPIDVKMGPDGAIYIADWYNPIIQHGEVDFRDPRRDHVHGRIWRVTAKGRPLLNTAIRPDASIDELLSLLTVPEDWTRLWAKLLLKERDSGEVMPRLQTWVRALDPQDPNVEHHRLEALWLYEALDVPEPKLLDELAHSKDHRVRAAAQRTAAHWRTRLAGDIAAGLFAAGVKDEHPRVRLEAVRGLAEVGTPTAAATALQALNKPLDRFLDFALWQTARDLEPAWLPAVRDGSLDFGGNVDHLTFALKAVDSPGVVAPLLELIKQNKLPHDRVDGVLALIASLGGPKDLSAVLDLVLNQDADLPVASRASLLAGLADTTFRRKVQPDGDLARVKGALESPAPAVRAAAARAVGAWKLAAFRELLSQWATETDETKAPLQLREGAIDGLAGLGGAESIAPLEKIALAEGTAAVRARAIGALAGLDTPRAARATVQLLQARPATLEPGSIVADLLAQRAGPAALAAALKDAKLPADDAKLLLRSVQTSAAPTPELLAAIRAAGRLEGAGWKLTPELQAKLVAEVAANGDPQRGEIVYRRKQLQCTKCHAIGGAGGRVGPDLVSIGATAQIDYLVEALLDPAKKVKENYHSVVVETDAGKVITGIPLRETKTELVLRDAEDREIVIPVGNIEERKEGRSLMPDGSADTLTQAEVVDLVRFLSELGKGSQFAVGQARVARRWQTLAWSKEAQFVLNRTSYDSAAGEHDAFVWEPVYSRVVGDLPIADLPSFVVHQGNNPTTFVRTQLEVTTAGLVRLALGDIEGLAIWIDGKPTPPQSELTIDFAVGRHQVTLAVDQKLRKPPVRLEILDAPGSKAQLQAVTGK